LINLVIENKKKNQIEAYNFVQYQQYEKLSLSLDMKFGAPADCSLSHTSRTWWYLRFEQELRVPSSFPLSAECSHTLRTPAQPSMFNSSSKHKTGIVLLLNGVATASGFGCVSDQQPFTSEAPREHCCTRS
jgi:hypothetical protein